MPPEVSSFSKAQGQGHVVILDPQHTLYLWYITTARTMLEVSQETQTKKGCSLTPQLCEVKPSTYM